MMCLVYLLFLLIYVYSYLSLASVFIVGKILSKAGYLTIPILLVGAGKTAELVKRALDRMPITTYKIIGYVDDNPNHHPSPKNIHALGPLKM